MSPILHTAPEVGEAVGAGRPVVALETTLVTHGFPRAQGLELARALEGEVRGQGAVPATIGVLEGALRVGLSRAELERLAAEDVAKLGPANLGARIASGRPGSTTVGATLIAAAGAQIRVFATGGIGGVHRGDAFDVSADLLALARHPVAVVCSGAKAVLHLPRTREALETLGVPVLGFGTDELPAFYRRSSGLPVDARFDSVGALAAAVASHFALETSTGVLIGNPIPTADELDTAAYESALSEALAQAEVTGVVGRDVTPFLLEELRRRTGGRSLESNRALLLSNARLAGQLAVELASTVLRITQPARNP